MNKDYNLLVIGNIESIYIIRYVKHLKETNPNAHIFFWGYERNYGMADESYLSCYDEYYTFDLKRLVGTSPVWMIKAISHIRKHFRTFAEGKHFDYINIHYIKPEYFFVLDYLKKYSSKLVLTPWGNDVYGAKGPFRQLVRRIYDAANYVTGCNNRFTRDFIKLFNIPLTKMVFCQVGVETYEYIIEHKRLTDAAEAKKQLGLDNHYIISCGYNAADSQQHIAIVEALGKAKGELPDNLLVVFPLTYHRDEDYIATIKAKVSEYGLNAVYFEKFLDMPQLFLLRQATDIFIHIQTADASSASLKEYLLCEKKVINGAWLQYPELKKDGVSPFFEVDSVEHLDKVIVDTYRAAPIAISRDTLKEIENEQWNVVIKDWNNLFSGIIRPIGGLE